MGDKEMQQPSSGRVTWTSAPAIGGIVHYHSYGTPGGEFQPEPRAAIVTAVAPVGETGPFASLKDKKAGDAPHVSLCVLNPSGLFFNVDVPYAAQPKPGHWSWPPSWELSPATSFAKRMQFPPGTCDHAATAVELLGKIGDSQPAEMSSTGRDIQLALIHSMLAVAEGLKAR